MMRFAMRWFWRELRAGELTIMLVSLIVAMTAFSGVAMFTDRVQSAIDAQIGRVLRADLMINSSTPIPAKWIEIATRHGVRTTSGIVLNSMMQGASRARLVSIRAVGEGYPLLGDIRLLRDGREVSFTHGPVKGEVWVDEDGLRALSVRVGDRISLGEADFKVGGVLAREMDGMLDMFSRMPAVIMHLDDVAATQLILPGSRVRYRLLMAGESTQLQAAREAIKPFLQAGQTIDDPRESRREIRDAAEKDQRFLKIAALLSVYLAAAAVMLAAQRFVARHADSVAVLRTLGLQSWQLKRLIYVQCAALFMLSVVPGVLLGWGVQQLLAMVASGMLDIMLPPPGWMAVGVSAMLAVILILGLCLPGLMRLRFVSPLRVLRQDSLGLRGGRWLALTATASLSGLIYWQSGGGKLAWVMLTGISLALILTGVIAWCLLALCMRIVPRRMLALYFAVRNLSARGMATVTQTSALALGFTALGILWVVRFDLIEGWRATLSQGVPNHFVINLQPAQLDRFTDAFSHAGLSVPETFPMVRARLQRIAGKSLQSISLAEKEDRRFAEREFNLSFGESIRPDNALVAGRATRADAHEWTIEQSMVKRLGIKLGDELCFDIQGSSSCGHVVGVRKVNWNSFRVNFFVIGTPAMLAGAPASHVSSFYLDSAHRPFADTLVKSLPNLTVFDVSALLDQVKVLVDAMLNAMSVVFAFAMLAGICVLYAATLNTHDARKQDVAVLRTLGAAGSLVRRMARYESLIVGAIAGLMAGLVALVSGEALARYVLELPVHASWWLPFAGLMSGALAVWLATLPFLRAVLNTSPARVLRE
ncbi:ABC transporter permease [Burkholderiaceae bacterium DAT-1]|nr:ABC transporter permease [Burkholderiaceae bacterium DAT-1]